MTTKALSTDHREGEARNASGGTLAYLCRFILNWPDRTEHLTGSLLICSNELLSRTKGHQNNG